MNADRPTRRQMLGGGVAATAALLAKRPEALGVEPPGDNEEVVPFLDPQPTDPDEPMVKWSELTDWITPREDFFHVSHYGTADVSVDDWRLDVTGLVGKPTSWSLEELKARPRREITATLECSGNGASPEFMGAIGNARWAGTPLAPLLREREPTSDATEVVFYGADEGEEKIRGEAYKQPFARSLSIDDAMREEILLAYEMNGAPLTKGHGHPLRLVVPGWYGIAWVKWLTRIHLQDSRLMNRFMARDYVTLRGHERNGEVVWKETSVTTMNVKSLVARVVRRPDGSVRVTGAAWTDGTPLDRVELKIDDGSWTPVKLHRDRQAKYAWTFWSYDWSSPPSGEHTLVSRAIDAEGHVQPAPDDPAIKLKKTYWEANQQVPRKIRL